MSAPVLEVAHLRKTYGDRVAVDDVSLTVQRGEVVGILGRNGAGKTTTVECLAGLRVPDAGHVRVLGLDPRTDGPALRERLALQLQESELPAALTVREALTLYASFYADPADPDALLADLGLTDQAGTRFGRLSGGQKQRVSVALALVGNPEVAILDELTTGLDPQARRDTWRLVEAVRDRGVTILLVTHLMEEAERLCDRIVVIDAGRVVATGTPADLAAQAGGDVVVRLSPDVPLPDGALDAVPGVHAVRLVPVPGAADRAPEVEVRCTDDAVQDVLVALAHAGVRAHRVRLEQRTLEDAFVRLTTQHSEV
ncbi:ABC transporter ATP-binding protein [Cellulomonas sp. ATA003]|uniref:ABC transporter ATP-binding protein n=1 Tax=Cellulomonas sp. ATA003 TaxID=3073064 RepID=UPI0028738C02|nr:ABC transporter ATP-binding protein [Cellulomonas sp. ATA003]WNB87190.1 ABC transporter ATP-binding protein [Cellulomonas sp. ATA003]